MATKKNENVAVDENIICAPLQRKTIVVKLMGDSPLIVHAWSIKAKREILGKQQKKASAGKQVRVPLREYAESLYLLGKDGILIGDDEMESITESITETTTYEEVQEMLSKYKYGFPCSALKACMIDTAFQQGLVAKKTTLKGAIQVQGEYMIIEGIPSVREDMVKIGGISKVSDLRYRAEFRQWSATVVIQYLANSVSASQIMSFLEYGGFCDGLGEWRASRDGSFGHFTPIITN